MCVCVCVCVCTYTCICVCVYIYRFVFIWVSQWSSGKESACNAEDPGLIPGLEKYIIIYLRAIYRYLIGRTDAEAEVPVLWPPDAKN